MINNETTPRFLRERYPLIKIVKFDDNNKLFYDARVNMVFIVSNDDLPVIYKYLSSIDKREPLSFTNQTQETNEIIIRLQSLQKKGVLLPGPVEQLISTDSKDIKAHIEYNLENILMRKFVLETTQQCNFRCKYCHNTIEPVFRHHTNKHMTLPIAKAAIDFYKGMYLRFYNKLPKDKKALLLEYFPPFIGFYGGESLLNWNLVENAYDYYVNAGWEAFGIKQENLKFTINTNLYVLTDRMLSFILKHKPILYVSLDGPKEENDRNRVTIDGEGTFDKVFANLQLLKKCDLDYFKNKTMVLCVEAEGNDIKSVHNFLDSLGCRIHYMPESPYGCIQKCPEKQILNIEKNEQIIIDTLINNYVKRMKDNDSNALDEFKSLYFLEDVENDTPYQRRNLSISLTCPLCVDNIMIDIDGDMHLCHKTDNSLPLGNVCNGGYDMQKMASAYINFGEKTNSIECRSCWAMNTCNYCAANRLKGGKWVNPTQAECDLHRRQMELHLKLFVAVYKLDPSILPKLMERERDYSHNRGVVDYNEFIRK